VRWLLVLVASCGWLPPDSPPQTPAPPDPLVHTWIVEDHVLAGNASVGDDDARAMHGRKLTVTASGYDAPFTGACDDAVRERHDRALDLLGADAHSAAIRFGLPGPVTEYTLSCPRNHRTVVLTIYVSGNRAMTCFGGACYALTSKR
jgi:hypothetical protein